MMRRQAVEPVLHWDAFTELVLDRWGRVSSQNVLTTFYAIFGGRGLKDIILLAIKPTQEESDAHDLAGRSWMYLPVGVVGEDGVVRYTEEGYAVQNDHKCSTRPFIARDGHAFRGPVATEKVRLFRDFVEARNISVDGESGLLTDELVEGHLGLFMRSIMADVGIPHYGDLTLKGANYWRHMYYASQERSKGDLRAALADRQKHTIETSWDYFRATVRTVAQLLRYV
jgi:hypothetical protein